MFNVDVSVVSTQPLINWTGTARSESFIVRTPALLPEKIISEEGPIVAASFCSDNRSICASVTFDERLLQRPLSSDVSTELAMGPCNVRPVLLLRSAPGALDARAPHRLDVDCPLLTVDQGNTMKAFSFLRNDVLWSCYYDMSSFFREKQREAVSSVNASVNSLLSSVELHNIVAGRRYELIVAKDSDDAERRWFQRWIIGEATTIQSNDIGEEGEHGAPVETIVTPMSAGHSSIPLMGDAWLAINFTAAVDNKVVVYSAF